MAWGAVVLKRLSEALEDGDDIYAVIRGVALNNDGEAKVGFTAPSVNGQVDVITQALAYAGLTPRDITLIEAHGTGTALGDPIEFAALDQVFRAGGPACALRPGIGQDLRRPHELRGGNRRADQGGAVDQASCTACAASLRSPIRDRAGRQSVLCEHPAKELDRDGATCGRRQLVWHRRHQRARDCR